MRTQVKMLTVLAMSGALVGCAHKQQNEAANPATAPTGPQVASTTRANDAVTDSGNSGAKSDDDNAAYFDFDSYLLRDNAVSQLEKVASKLRDTPHAKVRIEGNCDERGTAEYNLALGEHRAQAAKKYLERVGIKAARIKTVSYGSERPKYDGHDETAWAKNR